MGLQSKLYGTGFHLVVLLQGAGGRQNQKARPQTWSPRLSTPKPSLKRPEFPKTTLLSPEAILVYDPRNPPMALN